MKYKRMHCSLYFILYLIWSYNFCLCFDPNQEIWISASKKMVRDPILGLRICTLASLGFVCLFDTDRSGIGGQNDYHMLTSRSMENSPWCSRHRAHYTYHCLSDHLVRRPAFALIFPQYTPEESHEHYIHIHTWILCVQVHCLKKFHLSPFHWLNALPQGVKLKENAGYYSYTS